MKSYYPAYLLLQKIYNERVRTLGNLTIYKINEWEDAFGKKIPSNVIFEAIKFLELKNLVKVTSFRECSTCSITDEGNSAYGKFEKSEKYKDYLLEADKVTTQGHNISVFFDKKNTEHHNQILITKLNDACSAFFTEL